MRNTLLALGLVAAVAAPSFAHASCHSRKATGAIVGAVGGGFIGNALSHGNRVPGTLLGAGLGALAGHEIAGAGCHSYYRHAYYRRAHYRRAYYRDAYWRRRHEAYAPAPSRYADAGTGYGACATRDQAFYDERGNLIWRPVQVCR